METDLKEALRGRGTLYTNVDDAVLAQLVAVAEQHGLAAKQAAAAFDKFMTVHRPNVASVSAEDVAAFRNDHGKSGRKPLVARTNNLFNRASLDDLVLPDMGPTSGGGTTPLHQQPPPGTSQRITPYMSRVAARPVSATKAHTPATAGKFAERQNAGSVVATLNAHLEVPVAAQAAGVGGDSAEAMDVDDAAQQQSTAAAARCQIEMLGQPLGQSSKYMVDRLEDKVAYLERRIVLLEEAAEAALGLEPHPTGTAAQEQALFVGRVCCDSEGGRLNPQSLLLEGSMKTSGGARVRLEVSKCAAGYRLFPGQVVAVQGTNPSGHCIVAAAVVPGLPAPLPRSELEELAAHAAATGRRGLSVVVAAGPFTSAEDLEYAPLGALLDYCAAQQAQQAGSAGALPDVLLLLGPFVDAEHPLVRGGLVEETFEDIYASRVLSQVRRFSERLGGRTRVVLVPSARDAHHHPVLPQPPMHVAEAGAGAGGGALAAPNPATLRCNEVVLGCTSADWLMACNREEVSQAAAGGEREERLPALAAHLAAQRSYFPLFPPPPDVPLDCSRGAAALQLPCSPDLLVLPSDLAPFAKLAPLPQPQRPAAPSATDGTAAAAAAGEAAAAAAAAVAPPQCGSVVCINPGRLTKGASGGTFAHIHILPLPEALDVAAGAPTATNAPVLHQVDKRCRVDIKRI